MRMLAANDIPGLLCVSGRGVNGSSYYDYNVSGKISMKAMFEKNTITGDDLQRFLGELEKVIEEVKKYLLNIHCILLKPEYIYYEEGKYYFCYYPLGKDDFWEEFHVLT